MRKVMIGLMLALALLAACGGDDEPSPEDDIVEQADDALDDISAEEFVVVDGTDRLIITESCVDNSGTYKGQVEGGGLFILRSGGAAGDETFVDFQPAADADPLSSQTADDTIVSPEGTRTTGTSTVTTEDGANSLELSFQIVITEVDPTC